MKVLLAFMQDQDITWLEAAADDETIAGNPAGWEEEVQRVRSLARECKCEFRIIEAYIPDVAAAFETPKVVATQVAATGSPNRAWSK